MEQSSSTPPPGAQPLYGGAGGSRAPTAGPPEGGLRRWLAIAAVAAGVASAGLLALGLRDGSSGGSPLSPIAQAAERTSAVSGGRFSGSGQATASGVGITMNFRGVFNADDERSMMRITAASSASPQIAAMMNPLVAVQDGLTTYMYSPLFAAELPDGKTWMKMDLSEFVSESSDDLGPTNSMDATAVLAQLKLVSGNARVIGKERIRGVTTTHYAATIDPLLQAQQLRDAGNDLAADLVQSQTASSVDVWIDRHDLVRRVAMTIPFEIVGGAGSAMSMTMDFYGFGITPEIDVPSDDDSFDATELGKQALEQALGES